MPIVTIVQRTCGLCAQWLKYIFFKKEQAVDECRILRSPGQLHAILCLSQSLISGVSLSCKGSSTVSLFWKPDTPLPL